MSDPTAGVERVHGTLVASAANGVLLRGPPGAGKSDLALRLISAPWSWQLVADDQVQLVATADAVFGHPPGSIAGQIEVRGIGIISVPFAASAAIRLIIDLVPSQDVLRLPDGNEYASLLGRSILRASLHSFDASTPAKIALLLATCVQPR